MTAPPTCEAHADPRVAPTPAQSGYLRIMARHTAPVFETRRPKIGHIRVITREPGYSEARTLWVRSSANH